MAMKYKETAEMLHKDVVETRKDIKGIRTDLNHHMRRTALLEKAQAGIEKNQASMQEEIKPLTKRAMIEAAVGKGLIVLIGLGASCAAIFVAISKLSNM